MKEIELLNQLFDNTREHVSSSELKELLVFLKKIKHMSLYNAMLVKAQRPGCEFAATIAYWQRRFNRTIKPSANPLIILKPFGPVEFVYDLSDTQGDKLPEHIIYPFEPNGVISLADLETLKASMEVLGIGFSESEQGTQSGGYIAKLTKSGEMYVKVQAELYQIEKTHVVIVNRNLSPSANFATIVHELGHYFCGHLDARKNLTQNQKEFEAECVSFLVCNTLNIKPKSDVYLFQYLDAQHQVPFIEMVEVFQAAGEIERLRKKVPQPPAYKRIR